MENKLWELLQIMDGKLDDVVLSVGVMKDKVDGRGGLCDQVRDNSHKLETHQTYIDNQISNRKFLKRMGAAVSGIVATIIAILKFVFDVKIL